MCRVVNGAVVKALRAQPLQVRRGHFLLMEGKFDRVGAKHGVRRPQRGAAPIGHQCVDKGVGLSRCEWVIRRVCGDLVTEIVGV